MFDLIFLMFDLDFKNSNVQDCATKECREKRLFYTQRSQVPLPSSKCIRRLLQTRQGESTSNELPAFGDATFCGSLVEQKKTIFHPSQECSPKNFPKQAMSIRSGMFWSFERLPKEQSISDKTHGSSLIRQVPSVFLIEGVLDFLEESAEPFLHEAAPLFQQQFQQFNISNIIPNHSKFSWKLFQVSQLAAPGSIAVINYAIGPQRLAFQPYSTVE